MVAATDKQHLYICDWAAACVDSGAAVGRQETCSPLSAGAGSSSVEPQELLLPKQAHDMQDITWIDVDLLAVACADWSVRVRPARIMH